MFCGVVYKILRYTVLYMIIILCLVKRLEEAHTKSDWKSDEKPHES